MTTDVIRFDLTNTTDRAVGEHGIPDSLIKAETSRVEAIDADITRRRAEGILPFHDLPKADISGILAYAERARKQFDTFVNIGIGGSALGAQALMLALRHPFHNLLESSRRDGMRLFFADNIDPDQLDGLFSICDPRRTLFNVITKSGSTAETMGTFLVVRDILERTLGENWRDHIVVTTDASKGDLRVIADREKITSFVVPDGIGGRFSVLTPVGLLPAACAGIDIAGLLAGAAAMDKRLTDAPPMNNPAYRYALSHYLFDTRYHKPISVMMPYSSGLYGLADWNRQLWAESLGKRVTLDGAVVNCGPTPIKALGVTDQHSQVQLYIEGPFDKVFTILAVDRFTRTMPMPAAYPGTSSLDYLGGRTMAELMEAERLGTIHALTTNSRPNLTIGFPTVTPHTVGQFLHALEVATLFAGGLYNIDPLDQPGVEAGKIAAFALMGRPGYEDRAKAITSRLVTDNTHVF